MTPSELLQLQLILRIICSLSVILNISLIFCVLRYKHLQIPVNFLQVSLACTDIFTGVSWGIGNVIMNDNALCTVMGTFHQFFLNASPTWIFVISLYCYLTVMHDESTARKNWYWLHAYGWGLPFLLTISMFIGQSILNRGPVIGDGTYDCWIGPAYPDLRLYLYYPTLWMHFILIVVIYIRVLTKIRSVVDALKVITESSRLSTEARPTELSQACHTANDGKQQSIYNPEHRNSLSVRITCILPERTNTLSTFNKMMSLKTALIAISYIVSWTPATISRIIQFVPGTKAPYWLTLLAGINFAFSSIWSSLVFFGFLFESLWRNRRRNRRALSSSRMN